MQGVLNHFTIKVDRSGGSILFYAIVKETLGEIGQKRKKERVQRNKQ